jgi:membrane-bound serine protease (ClpP class)
MKSAFRILTVVLLALLLFQASFGVDEQNNLSTQGRTVKAAVIVCKGMIDDGLYKSIQRRTQIALDAGAEYLIYEISTYGGLLESGDNISKYFIFDVAKKAHTVAYVTTEAISAGAMISVSCQDIIMRKNTTIGDCAPIQIGAKLEGIEREKTESFTRAAFMRAAEANGYPAALLKAMVTMQIEVYKIQNLQSGKYEFFEAEQMPKDQKEYDIKNKVLIDSDKELLTLTASKAMEYGIARAVVDDRAEAFDFLAKRDGVTFSGEPMVFKTLWSEEMVRWLNSPVVMSVLIMLALLGVYIEFNTPGVVLPGLVAAICFAIIIGSKYLIGLANWVEIVIFVTGVLLLMVEIFVLPGFGITGFLGIMCILVGLFGMLVKNPPGKAPWPQTPLDWQLFTSEVWGLLSGLVGFVLLAWLLTKYMPKIPIARRLVLKPPDKTAMQASAAITGQPMESFVQPPIQTGVKGITISQLRPAGKATFGGRRFDVVSRGELIEADREIIVVLVEGNRIVVRETSNTRNVI